MLRLPSHVQQEGESRAQFEAVFSAIDADNNDCVSWDEFAAYFVTEGVVLSEDASAVLSEDASAPTYVQQQLKTPRQAQIQAQIHAQAQTHLAQSQIPVEQPRLQASRQGCERVQTQVNLRTQGQVQGQVRVRHKEGTGSSQVASSLTRSHSRKVSVLDNHVARAP